MALDRRTAAVALGSCWRQPRKLGFGGWDQSSVSLAFASNAPAFEKDREMISPHTPRGTDIVCVNDTPGRYGSGGLQKGVVYTVDYIEKSIMGGHVVMLVEIKPWKAFHPVWGPVHVGFELRRFRYLDIPKSIMNLLVAAQRKLEAAR
jgi:hypothetical protein